MLLDANTINGADACKAFCNADPSCVVFDYSANDKICDFYGSDGLSLVETNSNYDTYIKSGYSLISG